jgi:methylated-DNA-[protein]-cysteine S-methyltransferase
MNKINKNYSLHETLIGKILIASVGDTVTDIISDGHKNFGKGMFGELASADIRDTAAEQINEYLAGKRRAFGFKINPQGTPFQLEVWRALTAIPYGETRSYGQIAEAASNPKAFRAAGMANNKNPLMIVIPCHRVIGADGSLTGYAGGLWVKEKLLGIEGYGRVHSD